MHVSEERFEELVAEALDLVQDELARHIENVVVTVEDRPTKEQLGGRAGTLLGLYQGVTLTSRTPMNYEGALPDRITIFKDPISALSRDDRDLRNMVAVTVIHEVAHHFGISDARLHELGWG